MVNYHLYLDAPQLCVVELIVCFHVSTCNSNKPIEPYSQKYQIFESNWLVREYANNSISLIWDLRIY